VGAPATRLCRLGVSRATTPGGDGAVRAVSATAVHSYSSRAALAPSLSHTHTHTHTPSHRYRPPSACHHTHTRTQRRVVETQGAPPASLPLSLSFSRFCDHRVTRPCAPASSQLAEALGARTDARPLGHSGLSPWGRSSGTRALAQGANRCPRSLRLSMLFVSAPARDHTHSLPVLTPARITASPPNLNPTERAS
jgi:hypothetical protein